MYTMLGASDRAIELGLEYLRHVGIDWAAHPTAVEARREYERIWSQLGDREIEDLIDLPRMRDPESLATLDVLTVVAVPMAFTDENLYTLTIYRAVNLGLERGHSDHSPALYASVGLTAGYLFGDYDVGYRLGKLACALTEARGLNRFAARTYVVFTLLSPWTRPFRESIEAVQRAFQVANEQGDLTYAAYALSTLVSRRLASGDHLDLIAREADHGLAFSRKVGFEFVANMIFTFLALIRMLRGETAKFGPMDRSDFSERAFEERMTGYPVFALPECFYWIRKLQARFSGGDARSALDAAEKAERWFATSALLRMYLAEWSAYHLYAALSRAACCQPTGPDPYAVHQAALAAHYAQLRAWEVNCPANFENSAALVGAEIARIEGRPLDAMELYERAIRSARANGFAPNEALAYELAAQFYASRGFEQIARTYLTSARDGYLRWGALGKVRQLDQIHPHLRAGQPALAATDTIGAPVEHLDLTTIIKVSQAVSGEIVPQKLIDTLMRTAIEQAGAERGLLILARGGASPRIAAEATTGDDRVVVQPRDEAVTETVLPEAVLRYVLLSRESVILDDACARPPFVADAYIKDRRMRSVLCLPLTNQGTVIGALYLENNLTPHVFAPARIAVLKLVASQAAIALENSRLYSDLQEREAKVRSLVDANIIGILIWDFEGRVIEANDTLLRMLGFDRDDFASGRVRWTDLTPPEWRDRTAQTLEYIKIKGTIQPDEREYLRKDGSRVPVLIGAALLEHKVNQGVAFVLDLTERKRAETEARESERRYRETQTELAHANRVATMGQLTASIAHEVNQPLTAMIVSAEAALRWLSRQPPDLDEARPLLERIAKDGHRAGNVVNRTRDLVKKAPLRKENVEINGAIGEVIELLRAETTKNHISVHTQFAEGLPLVEADRTQLQQVVLNLIVNAVQALNEGGQARRELRISTAMDSASGVLVSVRDSGKGIRREQLERLFDPFYTTKARGMGMGLSICRSLIEGHGGRIWAGANLPHGAAFHFTIPQLDDPAAREAPSAPMGQSSSATL
ncbi:MAG: PAS domain S-box protein [Hyphomicrobiales bacterium]|nr:PAS domain S-box protein [Hyphomicrobiales bacterium]